MKEITKKQAKKIWKKLLKRHGINEVHLNRWYRAFRRRAVVGALESYGISAPEGLLNDRLVFVPIGSRAFLSVPDHFWVSRPGGYAWHVTVLTHELTHAEQAERLGAASFLAKYAARDYRAIFEGEAVYNGRRMGRYLGLTFPGTRTFDAAWEEMYKARAETAIAAYQSMRAPTQVFYEVADELKRAGVTE